MTTKLHGFCVLYIALVVFAAATSDVTAFQPLLKINQVSQIRQISPSVQFKPLLARINDPDFEDGTFSDRNAGISAEEEYRQKLAEAERAIAEAEKARIGLQQSRGPPFGAISRIEYTDAGTLVITTPPSGMKSDSVFAGAFSLAWFSTIIPATFAGPGLFMVPFWLAGGIVAKQAVVDPFVASELSIGKFAWSLGKRYAGKGLKKKEGSTNELRGAKVEVAVIVNGVPQAELRLYGEKGVSGFGLGLGGDELEYLAGEINSQLQKLKLESLDDDVV
mmetsp:Transcript_1059/g.1516  ORF Transcript_1059/g.1516 Transcript_1059/m.1516 type:complete len:277 (-) Transcript_1059:740-1570(-)